MAQATATISLIRPASPSLSITKPFEELPLFWQFIAGTPWRGGRIDGEFTVEFDHTGDWQFTDVSVLADNGRCGKEAAGRLVALNADTDERLYLLVMDALAAQYTTRIDEWIEDELAEIGGKAAA